MNLFYFHKEPNFGDSLNPWLWPQIFPGYCLPADTIFVGIGSILDERIPKFGRKIIFGSGFRPSKEAISADQSWDIRFVRGPLSSQQFDGAPWITDAAYCLGLLDLPPVEKKYPLSYIPHFLTQRHSPSFRKMTRTLGIHYIDPMKSVEVVLLEIRQSERVIAEAMHGAIAADIFRIPWLRVKHMAHLHEGENVSEFKWNDWCQSIGVTSDAPILRPLWPRLAKTSWLELLKDATQKAQLRRQLKSAAKQTFQLSDETIFRDRMAAMKQAVEELKKDLSPAG